MTFKEFTVWCNERACDGCWGMLTAMTCLDLMATVNKIPFWKREKVWREQYEKQVLDEIVEPINQKILIAKLAAQTLKSKHTDEIEIANEKENPTMTINEYQSHALRTESRIVADPVPYTLEFWRGLWDSMVKPARPSTSMKKVLFQDHEFDREHLAKELGDIAWYLAISADAIGYDLETILQMNVDKLKARYPDGFNSEQSQNRSANDI